MCAGWWPRYWKNNCSKMPLVKGRFELEQRNPSTISSWNYYGFYYRVNTNRVTAFQGPELSNDQWRRLFGHYLNLLLCGQVVEFLSWHHNNIHDQAKLTKSECEYISQLLRVDNSVDLPSLSANLRSNKKNSV